MAKALDGCLAVYPVDEFERGRRATCRKPRSRGATRAPGRPDVLRRRGRDHARQAGPGRDPAAPARVRRPRPRGDRGRQLRPHRDLGRRSGSASATSEGIGLDRRRRRHRRLHVTCHADPGQALEITTESGVPGPSPAPRPARLLAPTPPAFSRSRPGETSRAVPVDRGAGDGAGGRRGSGETVEETDVEAEFSHLPVMAREVVELLLPVPAGLIVDCTVGGGRPRGRCCSTRARPPPARDRP